MQYYIKQTEEFGRGLYASHDLLKGKILFSAELLVLSEKDTETLKKTDLKDYVFTFDDKRDCLVLGDGEIFNHSITPNVGYKIANHGERKVMYFYTLTDVKEHDQLFIDYAADLRNGEIMQTYTENLVE